MSERLLPLIRPIYETQPEIADARKAIDENGDLQARLDRQIRFDDQIVTELKAISLTDGQIEQLENLLVENPALEATTAPPAPELMTQPAVVVPPPSPLEPASHPTPASPATEPVPPAAAIAPVTVPETPESSEIPESQEPRPSEPKKEGETEQPIAKGQEEADKEEEKEEEPPRARTLTILAAVGIGIIATIALVAYLVWDQMNNSFSGKDQVTELLDSANTLTGDEFEAIPKSTTTADLKDWFFLKSEIRWFAVPKEFASTPALGCRVSKFKGADIGQILAKGDQDVILMFLFHPADLGVRIRKGKWTIVDGETWVGGVTAVEDCCFVVAFKGKHSEMQEYLDKKLKK